MFSKFAVDMHKAAAAYDCLRNLKMSVQVAVSKFDSIVQGCSSIPGQTDGDSNTD